MSFTVKRRQTKKPILKTPNKRLFRNFNIKGLKTRPILLTDAKGPKNKRPTRFIEPSMGPRSNIRLVFDGQAVQDAQDGAKALPELYRSLMGQKAEAEGIPLKDKLDRERAREEVKQQNRDEIEQYKQSKHYLDNIAEIQRRDLAAQQAQAAAPPLEQKDDGHEQKDGGSDDDSQVVGDAVADEANDDGDIDMDEIDTSESASLFDIFVFTYGNTQKKWKEAFNKDGVYNTNEKIKELATKYNIELKGAKNKEAMIERVIDFLISERKTANLAKKMNERLKSPADAQLESRLESLNLEEPDLSDSDPAAAASPPQGGNGRHSAGMRWYFPYGERPRHRHHRRNPVTHVINLKNTLHGRGRGRVSALSLL